ncbi:MULTISPECIES: hypothetical protein [unclassified Paenibacillus]|uniref:hypothetical protein n=1 Tax=unclassified Paenibacillus TaxID=185978 RepID=UPI0036305B5D
MKKGLIFLFILLLTVLGSNTAKAKDAPASTPITYIFDQVKVLYVLEFTARPSGSVEDNSNVLTIAKPVTGNVYGSVSDSVYGKPQPVSANEIRVLYGVVELGSGAAAFTEEFIKIDGGISSARSLAGGGKRDFYDSQYSRLRAINTYFNIGKKLEGNKVIKDYSVLPKLSI